MNYQGRWITGEDGADRLAELRGQLDARDVADAGAANGQSYRFFEPWMSSARLRSEQQARPYPLGSMIQAHQPRVIEQPGDLQRLSAYLQRDGHAGLSLIGSKDALQLKVEDPEAPWLEQTRALAPRAVDLLMDVSLSWRLRIQTLCQMIVPIGSALSDGARRDVGRGFSSHFFRGAVFMDPPSTEDHRFEAYAINLAHEIGHQAFFVYQCADKIIDGPLETPVYSVIRKTERPAIQSYHAVVAAAYMAEFIGDWLSKGGLDADDATYLQSRLTENITHVEDGAAALATLKYTDIGQQILSEMLDLAGYLRRVHGV